MPYLEEDIARKKLCQDAAEGPDINFLPIGQAQNDFWGSVRARLHITAELICSEAR